MTLAIWLLQVAGYCVTVWGLIDITGLCGVAPLTLRFFLIAAAICVLMVKDVHMEFRDRDG